MTIAIDIRRISAEDTVLLRHSVLWPDHPVSHVLLPEDASGFHYGAFLPGGDRPTAVVSVFVDALPRAGSDDRARAARFRKFACDPARQGRGVGTRLLAHAFNAAAAEMKCDVIWCDARTSAAGWYERRGMVRFGDTFFKGDVEYVKMKKALL
ncbi:GCN5-related N-acetyltransferase [Epithele typhae]|uniref:GCN5-related N-acetyltransferase n=1 Tax=Epithele typhae TaxID=378194 RepID=UPI002008553C|nr:GCN5-related N-acetyltransferase [Epithele typhae]KAH9932825.1 GCN5-related N-acetyltransferase [Epithele typhae]